MVNHRKGPLSEKGGAAVPEEQSASLEQPLRPRRREHESIVSDALIEAGFWLLFGRAHGGEDVSDTVPDAVPEATSAMRAEDSTAQELPSTSAHPSLPDTDLAPATELAAVTEFLSASGYPRATVTQLVGEIAAGRAVASAKQGASLSAARYEQLRTRVLAELGQRPSKGVTLWPVTSQTVMKRIGGGSWADALRALGVGVSSRGRARQGLRFVPGDYVDAVVAFLRDAGAGGSAPGRGANAQSYSSYVRWVGEQRAAGVERPSGSAMRAHFGNWSAAIAAASEPRQD